MFKKIASSIQYPAWVTECPRYRRLDLLDRLLDGTFYDHLPYAFYDERDGQGRPNRIDQRRPSVRFNFPAEVARYTARKLFAGNHAPRIAHQDEATRMAIGRLMKECGFLPTMLEAAFRGSTGAVAVTFRIERDDASGLRAALNVWQAKFCEPDFDSMGELLRLRVRFCTSGAWLLAVGAPAQDAAGKDMRPNDQYWFIRDYGIADEVTYVPVPQAEWDPVNGFYKEGRTLSVWQEIRHGLGFVPGHWFRNLVGGEAPDGDCTWRPGIPNSIELDYTLSQIGRGIRYNAAPTLVTIGEVLNSGEDGAITRGPTLAIQMSAGVKGDDGVAYGQGDAKLLEMTGAGTDAALKYIDKLHDLALEQVAAARKDPEKMKGPMSGRAMEFIDQEFHDLVMELRTQYGEHGALPLLRKMVQAVAPETDLSTLRLIWPRLYQPTPTDLAQVIPALAIGIDPLKAGPAMPAEPGGVGADGKPTPGKPATGGPDPAWALIDVESARAWLRVNMDLDLPGSDDDSPPEPTDDTPDHDDDPRAPPPDQGWAGDAAPGQGGDAIDLTNPLGPIPRPVDAGRDG